MGMLTDKSEIDKGSGLGGTGLYSQHPGDRNNYLYEFKIAVSRKKSVREHRNSFCTTEEKFGSINQYSKLKSYSCH